MTSQVITNVECLEQMKMSEKKTQTQKRKATKAKQARIRKMADDMETESTTSESSVSTDGRNMSSEISLTDFLYPHLSDEDNTAAATDNTAAAADHSNMSTGPVVTKESVNKYVTVLYNEPKLKYY